MGEVIVKQSKQIDDLESALSLIEKLNEKPLSLDKAAYCVKVLKVYPFNSVSFPSEFTKFLQERHNPEYEIYEMGTMASNLISPILRDKLKSWQPLESPTFFTTEFQRWQKILEGEKSHTLSTAAAKDPYHTLVWGAWTPSIRTAAK